MKFLIPHMIGLVIEEKGNEIYLVENNLSIDRIIEFIGCTLEEVKERKTTIVTSTRTLYLSCNLGLLKILNCFSDNLFHIIK